MKALGNSNIAGMRFGRLTALAACSNVESMAAKWLCSCNCGKEKTVDSYGLRSGRVRSCGCLKKEHAGHLNRKHGMSTSPTYMSWKSMIGRCQRAVTNSYRSYGGRGISICERWHTFEAFLADMGERPIGTSLDRINCDGNYEPSNCRWATAKEQAQNKRKRI